MDEKDLQIIRNILDKYVYDWGTCDSISGKIVGRILKIHPEYSKIVFTWKNSEHLWTKRAACVSFVPVARFGKHNRTIKEIALTCVKSEERFVQLGCGWMLRELSLADLKLVVDFIKQNYASFSREGLRYAIEKMNPELQDELLNYNKNVIVVKDKKNNFC